MDLAYWGLKYWPFERTWSPSRFFAGSLHEEALARLMFLVEEERRSGIVVGSSGTGKTYLLKLAQQRAERMGRLTVRCDATSNDGHELASQIAASCHVPCGPDASSTKIWSGLNSRFEAMSIVRQPLVVIIDHFDFVQADCQHTIRRLNQLADSTGVKLTILIATRDQEVVRASSEILDLKIELGPWTVDECLQFVNVATQQAGTNQALFTYEAVLSLHKITQGIPAKMISLCNLSLLAAREREKRVVTREIINGLTSEIAPTTANDHLQQWFENSHQMLIR